MIFFKVLFSLKNIDSYNLFVFISFAHTTKTKWYAAALYSIDYTIRSEYKLLYIYFKYTTLACQARTTPTLNAPHIYVAHPPPNDDIFFKYTHLWHFYVLLCVINTIYNFCIKMFADAVASFATFVGTLVRTNYLSSWFFRQFVPSYSAVVVQLISWWI